MYSSYHGGNTFPALMELTFQHEKRQSVNIRINNMLKNESALNIRLGLTAVHVLVSFPSSDKYLFSTF